MLAKMLAGCCTRKRRAAEECGPPPKRPKEEEEKEEKEEKEDEAPEMKVVSSVVSFPRSVLASALSEQFIPELARMVADFVFEPRIECDAAASAWLQKELSGAWITGCHEHKMVVHASNAILRPWQAVDHKPTDLAKDDGEESAVPIAASVVHLPFVLVNNDPDIAQFKSWLLDHPNIDSKPPTEWGGREYLAHVRRTAKTRRTHDVSRKQLVRSAW